jgi:hypothetical protein
MIIDAEAFEAFGLDAPNEGADDTAADKGGEEITPDDKAGTTPNEGGGDDAPPDGSGDGDSDDSDDGADDDETDASGSGGANSDGDKPGAKEQSGADDDAANHARNARNAERRRQNEARVKARIDAATDAARREERARLESTVKSLGITDPESGKPIADIDTLEKYRAARAFETAREGFANGELTPEAFNALVEQTPAFQKAASVLQQAEAAERQARTTRAETEVAEQITQIGRYDPSVKSIDDLLKLDKSEVLRAYVMDKGLTLIDAYRLTYDEEIESKRANTAAAEATKLARSKQHLTRTQQRGGAPAEVPDDIVKAYRDVLGTDMSYEDICKAYAENKI